MVQTVFINTAAALLGVSRRTIYNYIKSGRLDTVRTPNGSQRVTIDSLLRASVGSCAIPGDHIPDRATPDLAALTTVTRNRH